MVNNKIKPLTLRNHEISNCKINLFMVFDKIEGIAIIFTAVAAIIYALIKYVVGKHTKNELMKPFEQTVSQLSSFSPETQLSAAILLRRYINAKYLFRRVLQDESINVISSLLRVLPTGIYQKTLGDGLGGVRGPGLNDKDMQSVNFQNLYFGNKKFRIRCRRTDFYKADFSYALFQNVDARGAQFRDAIFLQTRIKDCNMSDACFKGADFLNVYLENVVLYNSSFEMAVNIPEEVVLWLDENKKCVCKQPINSVKPSKGKNIFFSMAGKLSKRDEIITKEYEKILKERGYNVYYYVKDHYPKYGQLNSVKEEVLRSVGVIIFGFKQLRILKGELLPDTDYAKSLNDLWLSTPWSEIELGMAVMSGLPILLVHDDEISTGAFDENLSECYKQMVRSEYDIKQIESSEAFRLWYENIRK